MAEQVCMGAMLECSFGLVPSGLLVERNVLTTTPAANIMDNVPFKNIMPFGMCTSLANPEVAAATTAALGVLTPMPCIPVTVESPWLPGVLNVLIEGAPAIDRNCKLMCMWAGIIQVVEPGQFKVTTE